MTAETLIFATSTPLFVPQLIEINLYPYLTWVFYGALLFLSPFFFQRDKRFFSLFLVSLALETAFVIDVGFFIRPSYILGLILIARTVGHGLQFPARYTVLLSLFALIGLTGVFLNLDLLGKAQSGESRATFLRPLIQMGQLTTMILIAAAVFTNLRRKQFFLTLVRVLHWVAVSVAVAALYELAAIYFHLPYLNLNNMLPEYWYPGFGSPLGYIVRARVTFIEPIELNNFQMFGLASSLSYGVLWGKKGWRYWSLILLQLIPFIGTFSRSTLLTTFVLVPVLILFYPRAIKSSLGFVVDRVIRVVVVALLIFLVHFSLTATPQQIRQSNPLIETLFTRLILHRSEDDLLKPWGRAKADEEVQALVSDGRLSFGVGIGNEANWWGGIGGTYNIYNQIIIYTGLIGFLIFFIFLSSLLFGLFQNYWSKVNDLALRRVSWIFFIGLVGIMVQRLSFSGLLTDTYLWVAFAVAAYLGQVKSSIDLYQVNKS